MVELARRGGVLIVDKPGGVTTESLVAAVRKRELGGGGQIIDGQKVDDQTFDDQTFDGEAVGGEGGGGQAMGGGGVRGGRRLGMGRST